MATTVLLGPQRFMTTAGTTLRAVAPEGAVATVTAGWEEREDQDGELDAVLGGRSHNLRLYHRMFDVLDKDARFAAAALAFRDRHDELMAFYRLRLEGAMGDVYAVQRRPSAHGTGAAALEDAVEAVRRLDEWYSSTLKELYREIDAQAPAAESEVVAWHRGEIAAALAGCAALVVTGGHVGTLLRALRLFAPPVPAELPVVAWSAGAMALTAKVVLFHDHAPQGSHEAEVFDRGLGRVPGVIALPHARRRLRLDDHTRVAVLARRFREHRLLLLDDGTSVAFTSDGAPHASAGDGAVAGAPVAYPALPPGARVLTSDGVVEQVGEP